MKKGLKLGLVVLIVIVIILLILILQSVVEVDCSVDDDCDFHYTAYSENNHCGGCDISDEEYVCMNKEKAQQEYEEKIKEIYGDISAVPACSQCPPESNLDSHVCRCVDNKCVKTEA